MKPEYPEDNTVSTEMDVSFQKISKRSSHNDIDVCPPPPAPLKQHVTIGGSDVGKQIHSLLKRSGSSQLTYSSDDSIQKFLPNCMSETRVSQIFLRERNQQNLASDGRFSRKSNFVADLQALFDTDELEELSEELRVSTTPTSPTKTSTGLIRKGCTFGGVEIREYPIVPGVSPAGFKGPPLTIGWTPVSTVRIAHIDKYESVREGHRRAYKELNMPATQRMEILRNQGFARSEINKSIKEANIGRRQRKETMSTLKHEATYEKLESIQRTALNILTLGRRKKAQRKYLQKYVPSYYGVAPIPAQ